MPSQNPPDSRRTAPIKRTPTRKIRAQAGAEKPKPGESFPIVGVGASAGGFEAVMALLKALPESPGMALVVVQHLDPTHESKLTELLSKPSKLPVSEIHSGEKVLPDRVYVLTPNVDVTIVRGVLRLVKRSRKNRLHLPINQFLESLARDVKSRAVGVILSGTGSDGTAGLIAIRENGGFSFAQSEKSAKHFDMPSSAIASGCVDAILAPAGIANELVKIAGAHYERPPQLAERDAAPDGETGPESANFARGFYLLKQHRGVDFSGYKIGTLRRPILRRMELKRYDSTAEYLRFLRKNPDEIEALFHDLLINVTGFFRNKQAFLALKKKVFPQIFKNNRTTGEIRIWVAGCATGEEVYSLAICLVEELAAARLKMRVQIFGTDLSETAIRTARAGRYPENIDKDVSPERLRRFFKKVDSSYLIDRSIRSLCTFASQNICQDPPFSRLDLISCRNVLIYLGPGLQQRVLPIFHFGLKPGGFLMLSPSETVAGFADLFSFIDNREKIYVKKPTSLTPDLWFAPRAPTGVRRDLTAGETRISTASELEKQVDRVLLQHYAPAGVLVDSRMQVQQFRGRTGPYVEHAAGTASLNLLQIVRPSLVVDLRALVHRALRSDKPVKLKGASVKYNGVSKTVTLHVAPMRLTPSKERALLVLFEPDADESLSGKKLKGRARKARGTIDPDEAESLRDELNATKESLQAIIEEQKASNEELKSANEEIESSNEELQSTNEELQTAKEERQSGNEELTTLNEELNNRNVEMEKLNDDLSNLLSSVNIPIVMVDHGLTVRRLTPLARQLFNLIPSDIGRRLTDIKPNVKVENFDEMIRNVIDKLAPRESEVQDRDGRWYSLCIRPYRTKENRIDGAVITLTDIDAARRAMAQLRLASEFSGAIVDTLHEPILVLDGELRVRHASPAFYQTFKTSEKRTIGTFIYELNDGEWNNPALRELLEKILPNKSSFRDFEIEFAHLDGGRTRMRLNARQLEKEGERMILLAMENSRAQTPSL